MKIKEIASKENDSTRELELVSDVTFLLGANGYGKSTSLDAIRKALLADRKKALDLDVTKVAPQKARLFIAEMNEGVRQPKQKPFRLFY